MEGLNPVANYILPPFQDNVSTEGESNVIAFNKEMHEDLCECIILRNCRLNEALQRGVLEMHFLLKAIRLVSIAK